MKLFARACLVLLLGGLAASTHAMSAAKKEKLLTDEKAAFTKAIQKIKGVPTNDIVATASINLSFASLVITGTEVVHCRTLLGTKVWERLSFSDIASVEFIPDALGYLSDGSKFPAPGIRIRLKQAVKKPKIDWSGLKTDPMTLSIGVSSVVVFSNGVAGDGRLIDLDLKADPAPAEMLAAILRAKVESSHTAQATSASPP